MLPFFVIKRFGSLEKKARQLYLKRAAQIVPKISPFIQKNDQVIDIGCGTGSVAKLVKKETQANVTLVDVAYNPICDEYPVLIYDGKNLPFSNNQFTVSLLTAVLHHAENPYKVLDEAIRVTSNKIIVMEDVFSDFLGRAVTFVGDTILNWEIHSPFNSKKTDEWLKIFKKKNLKLVHLEEFNLRVVGFPFKLAIFVLRKG